MRGHLVQRGDRYDAVVDEGIDPATGKDATGGDPAGTTRRGAEKVLGDHRHFELRSPRSATRAPTRGT